MSKRGLPETVRMRHEAHYVETLSASSGKPIGRMVPIDRVDPNPDQPRQVMGDLTELKASIVEKGIIEPLIVRPRGERYGIIAGERRYQAAVAARPGRAPGGRASRGRIREHRAGAHREPPAQEPDRVRGSRGAPGARRALRLHARAACQAARQVPARRSPRLSVSTRCRKRLQRLCRLADIASKSVLLEIVRQRSPEAMLAFIAQITRDGDATRQRARETAASRRGTGTGQAVRVPVRAAEPDVQSAAGVPQDERAAGSTDRGARGHPRRPARFGGRVGLRRVKRGGVSGSVSDTGPGCARCPKLT